MACGAALDTVEGSPSESVNRRGVSASPSTPGELTKVRRIKLAPVAVTLVVALLVILGAWHYSRGVTLTIKTVPGGTAVLLDGRAMGNTGLDGYLRIEHLRPGSHQLTLQHGGFQDVVQTVTVRVFDFSKSVDVSLAQFGEESTVTGLPSETYKALYAAVKAKDSDAIKSQLSAATLEVMTAAAAAQHRPFNEVIANGLTESTSAATLPEICQDRIKGRFGALEVKRTDGKWEDLPFVAENGKWKLAAGEMFKGAYRSPGDPICMNAAPTPTPTP